MSLAMDVVCCNQCDETWSAGNGPYRPTYQNTKGDTFDIGRNTSWCIDCNQVVQSENFKERLKSINWYERHVRRLSRLRLAMPSGVFMAAYYKFRKYCLLKTKNKITKPSISDLPAFLRPAQETIDTLNMRQSYEVYLSNKRTTVKFALDELYYRLNNSNFWFDFLSKRQTPEKCLRCGGTNFQKLNIAWKEENICEETSNHPGCDGKLYKRESSMRNGLPHQIILFNGEGNTI